MAKDLYTKLIINAEDNTKGAFSKTRAGLESISQQLANMQTRLYQLGGLKIADIIGNKFGDIIKTADAYKSLEARLKLVSDNQGEFNTAQKETLEIAQRTRASLEATASVYGKFETVIKQLGGTQQDALKTTETLNKAIALTSQGTAQDAAAIQQFSQALASGVLRGDEFNSVMENSPGLAQALAAGLDVPITKLRGMAEAGELTADKLVNALGKSAPEVAKQFATLPVTVGGAMTQLSNAVTKFIGEADKGTGASGKLAAGIQAVSKNLDSVVDLGIIVAELFGARMVLAMSKSAQASLQAAAAAKAKAAADLLARNAAIELLKSKVSLLTAEQEELRVNVTAAKLNVELAATDKARTAAVKALDKAQKDLNRNIEGVNTKQAALNLALSTGSAKATGLAGVMEKLGAAMRTAFTIKISIDAISGLLEMLGQSNEKIRIFSFAWQGAVEKVMAVIGHFLSLDFLGGNDQLSAKLDEIDRKYGDLALAATDSAQKIQQGETTKAAAVEQAAVAQQQSFAKVQEAAKALTASIDAETKSQTDALQAALTERLALIDASNTSEAEKATLRVNAQIEAARQETTLQQEAVAAKLAVIDQEYAKEIASAQANKDRVNQLETEKHQAKLAVYTGLADYYQGEVNRLSQVYVTEFQAAVQAKQALEQLNQSHEQRLFAIKLQGMTDKQKLEAEQSRLDDITRQARQLREKDAIGNQEKINQLLTEAGNLNATITAAAGNRSDALSKANDNEKTIYAEQKKELEAVAKSHEDNAARAKAAQTGVADKLAETKATISEITGELNKDYVLKVSADPVSVRTLRELIAELTAPAEKLITIRTVTVDGGAVDSGNSGQANGGNGVPNVGQLTNGLPGLKEPIVVPNIRVPSVPSAGGGSNVNVSLNLNGKQSAGRFPDTAQTHDLLRELKNAGAVSR